MFTPTPAGRTRSGSSLAKTAADKTFKPKMQVTKMRPIKKIRLVDFLNLHIRCQSLDAAFTAKATFFVTTERTCGIELIISVRPDNAGAELVHHLENLAAFVGPNARAQTIRSIVRALERFFRGAKCHDAQHRP